MRNPLSCILPPPNVTENELKKCATCGRKKASERRICDDCRLKAKIYALDYARRNRDKINARQKAYRASRRNWVAACNSRHRIKNAANINNGKSVRSRRLRMEALEAYGGAKCALCNESRLASLTIDHINGGGKKHRAKEGISASHSFYHWLQKNGFPLGYRVLCFNHNVLAYLDQPRQLSIRYKSKWARKNTAEIKDKFMAALGGECVICGCKDRRLLTVHHQNHDGAEHRRSVSDGKGGHYFYRVVMKSGIWDGLECRCFSCNEAAREDEMKK